jgi:hypothetical protein
MHDEDEKEAASIIAWTERRIDYQTDLGMVHVYMNLFKKMWLESFGTLENVPVEFKSKIEKLILKLKSQ